MLSKSCQVSTMPLQGCLWYNVEPEVQVYQAVGACSHNAPVQRGLFAAPVHMSLLTDFHWCQLGLLLCAGETHWNSVNCRVIQRVYFSVTFQMNRLLFSQVACRFCRLGCKHWIDLTQLYFLTNYIWFWLLLFSVRRLGIELGKSVVYQEPNRGEAAVPFKDTHLISSSRISENRTTKTHNAFWILLWIVSETRVDVEESVRGQDIFIIQTIPRCELAAPQSLSHGVPLNTLHHVQVNLSGTKQRLQFMMRPSVTYVHSLWHGNSRCKQHIVQHSILNNKYIQMDCYMLMFILWTSEVISMGFAPMIELWKDVDVDRDTLHCICRYIMNCNLHVDVFKQHVQHC